MVEASLSVGHTAAASQSPSTPASDGPRAIYAFGSDRFFKRGAVLYLLTHVLEAPLRLLLITAHIEPLLYTRDLLLVAMLLSALLSARFGRSVTPLVAFCALLAFHLLVGLVTLPALIQPLMGAKQMLPLLFGMLMAPLVERHLASCIRFGVFVFFVTCAGVCLNALIDFPWVGLTFNNGIAAVEVSRDWSFDGGLRRLPGFTRASYVAASIVLFSMVPCFALSRSLPWRGFVLTIAVSIIGLTTTRGAWSGAIGLVIFEAIWALFGPGLWGLATILLALFCLALPVVGVSLRLGHHEVPFWQLSFVERLQDMWPRAFELLTDWTQVLWGRGLGGIGMGQFLGEPDRFNAADNMMVYVIVACGALGLTYVAALLIAALKYVTASNHAELSGLVRSWLVIWLSFGLTTNMLEDIGMEAAIGVVAGLALKIATSSGSERAVLRGSLNGA